ncbi:hypothetical protein [Streptomyces carpinensis]|uniref:Uncharacterized protein n=1 Tax=Streptomyces carpinensis TaxID=66369 RepID=A0ABV1W9Y9_9ACTN|nr:hypothetical protein [Streptomyces carpinensis]
MDPVTFSGLSRISRVHFFLAWALCALAILLVAATWLPGPNKVSSAAVGTVFVSCFPVFGFALLRAAFSEGGRTLLGRTNGGPVLRFLRSLPTGLKFSYAVVLAAVLLSVATGGAARDAAADGHGGYHSTKWDNTELRSDRIELSEDEYQKATKAEARLSASWAAFFHSVSGLLALVAVQPPAACP